MSLADFTALVPTLKKARLAGNQIHCCCPAHEDNEPSCVVTLGEGGNVLAHCHAGCDQAAVWDAIRARLPRREPPPRTNRRIVATYDYHDEHGATLFQVVRFAPKDFRQRLPDGTWKLGATRRVLYHLPDVLASAEVVVVEGEKAADRLRQLGPTVTCSPGGAGKWRKAYAGFLKGKDVIVLPDNDEPGRKHAADVVASLLPVAKSVRVLELPGLPEKGDPWDWLEQGHTLDELLTLIRATPEVEARDAPASEPLGKGDETGWHAALIRDGQKVARVEANVAIALRQAPELAGRVRLNLLKHAVECRDLPWGRPEVGRSPGEWHPWEDEDDTQLAMWLQGNGVFVKPTPCGTAVLVVARDQPHHPVRAYLESVRWDGVDRLATFFQAYFGARLDPERADHAAYLAATAQVMLAQAVARVMEPGCKADYTVVLESMQGRKKSAMLEELVPDRTWFTSQISKLGTKDASLDLQGKWLVELAELSAIKRAEVEAVKAFLSEKVDHFRPPYGHRPRDFPRQSITIATTNEECYLQDPTGNRRFLPVRCGRTDYAALVRDRDQLWAQAVVLYRQGGWWLEDKLEPLARDQQDARHQGDPWEDLVRDWLTRQTFEDCSTNEVLADAIHMPAERRDRAAQIRVGHIMRQLGWETFRPGNGSARERRYRRGPILRDAASNREAGLLDGEKPSDINPPSNTSNRSNMNHEILYGHARTRDMTRAGAPESVSDPAPEIGRSDGALKPKGFSPVQSGARPIGRAENGPETPSEPGFDGCSDTDE